MNSCRGSDPPLNSALSTSVGYAAGAVGYALLLGAMGVLLGGVGHGVMFFLGVALSGLAFWLVAAAALAWSDRPTGRTAFVAAMSFHYSHAWFIVSCSDERSRLEHSWVVLSWLMLTYVATYCAGQAVMWWAFAKRLGLSRVQFTLRRMMVAVAVVAAILAWVVTIGRYYSGSIGEDAIVVPESPVDVRQNAVAHP